MLLAALLFLPHSWAGAVKDGHHVAKLDAVVTFEARYLPLADWAAAISRETGRRITVSKALSKRKITIICRRRPASEVMHQVAVALGLKWTEAKDGGLRAELDDAVKIAEREAEQYEESARLARLQKTLKAAIDRADLSAEQIRADLARVYKHIQQLELEHRSSDDAEMLAARDEYRLVTTSPLYFKFLASVGATGSEALEALSRGQPAFGSSDGADRVALLPGSVLTSLSGEKSGVAFGYIEQSADGMRLDGKIYRVGDFGTMFGRLGTPLPVVEQPNAPKLRKWFSVWASQQSAAVLSTPVADPEPNFQSALYSDGPYDKAVSSTADQVVDLAKRSGLSIISDAFRRPAYRRAAIRSKTVSEWIANFNRSQIEDDIDFTPGFVRASDGWLMFRHDRYWVNLALEIPEDLIAKMAALPRSGIDEYAWLASELTWQQLAGTRRRALLPFQVAPLSSYGRLLLFWSLLQSEQRSAIRSSGLALASLAPEQIRSLSLAMLDVQTPNIKDYVDILRHLVRNEPILGNAVLQLAEPTAGKSDPANQQPNARSQFQLTFGDQNAITWTIPLPVR